MSESISMKSEKPLAGQVTVWMWVRAVLIIGCLPALALFLPAGTTDWPMAWIYVGLTIVSFAGSRLVVARLHPDTLVERGKMLDHADAKAWDRKLSFTMGLLGPLATYITAGLAYRFGWGAAVPLWAQLGALGVYAVCCVTGSWALVVNRFFSGVVRIQTDRGHTVVSSGPYAIVRHPGYSSAAIGYLALPVLLGAYWALVPAAVTIALLVLRTALEDRTLREELPGYEAYTQKTSYRLVPGIW
jgi:protein-S-isoprenylcysteine O-methyltransferase Ste14